MKTLKSNSSQTQKILNVMRTDPERWWLPHDFMDMSLGDNFVGYEASARLSELAKNGKVESRKEGKFLARRLLKHQTRVNPAVKAAIENDNSFSQVVFNINFTDTTAAKRRMF